MSFCDDISDGHRRGSSEQATCPSNENANGGLAILLC